MSGIGNFLAILHGEAVFYFFGRMSSRYIYSWAVIWELATTSVRDGWVYVFGIFRRIGKMGSAWLVSSCVLLRYVKFRIGDVHLPIAFTFSFLLWLSVF